MGVQDYTQESRSSNDKVIGREKLYQLFKDRPMPDDQLLISMGMYMRSSALTKILYINELYNLIRDIPGVIMEFGIWWGQNIILFENLRAIYEPFNFDRRIIGFDTFKGYTNISEKDVQSGTIKETGYTVSREYREYLLELIDYHEQENVLYNGRKHQLIEGDATETIEGFLKKEPHTVIALAYFDMALYEPTKKCLEQIRPHLIKGSIITLDEFNSPEYPGETIALKEVWGLDKYRIVKSKFMPGRSYIIIE
jgi:hypothetical protein